MLENEGSEFTSLLQTKLFAPSPKPGLVKRFHLLDRLNTYFLGEGGFGRKLTLIAAPAGYGKTTLASQWLPTIEVPVSWLSLEVEDNDPTRFMRYLIGALQQISPDVGLESQAMLQAPQKPPDEVLLTPLINDLAAKPELLMLVLDDYHVIHTSAIHKTLNFLIEHIPETLHLVIATREDPPLAIPRLQAKGQALVIRQADLAFTKEEAAKFFRQQADIELGEDEAAALTRRTEGWVTGLQLAALSMRGTKDRVEFIRSFTGSDRFVLDYLFEEVFSQQSEEIQAFLLKTAVLDRFCSELCDMVLEREGTQAVIQDLERAHFFIVPLDQSRRWYRYHRLFSDLLLHRLRTGESGVEVRMHLRASQWFEEHSYPSEAIDHALVAQDWERSARLIAQEQGAILRKGEVTTLLAWCQRLPDSIRLASPDLALAHAWTLILIGEIEQADTILEAAKQQAGESTRLQGEIASAEAFIARTLGDMPLTVDLSKKALALLPEEDRVSRGNLSVNLGIITWHLGQLEETERVLREGLADSLATDNQYAAHTAQVFLARTLTSRGRLREAKVLYEQALEVGDQVPTAVIAHLDMAALCFEWNDLTKNFEHLERAIRIAGIIRNLEFQVVCHVQRALTHLDLGELDAASEALQASEMLVKDEDLPLFTRARRTAYRVQYALASGDLMTARRWQALMPVEHDARTFYRFLDLNTARIHLAERQYDRARDRLVKTYEKAHGSGWVYAALTVRVLQSLVAESQETALDFLSDVLIRAQPEGYLRLFLNEGEALIPLLKEAARKGVTPGYIGKILSVYEGTKVAASKQSYKLIESLTERELEVLRLVAAGLSNRQIAEQLIVSLGTTKSHIHHIFGKLDVSSRTEAAARARDLGLI
jgi:LuxR family maltose regulon positive regulatory protein